MVGRLTTMEVPPLRHLDVNVGVGVFGLEGRFSFDRPQALSVERSSGWISCQCVCMYQWHVSVACISDMYQWHVSVRCGFTSACGCISDMYQLPVRVHVSVPLIHVTDTCTHTGSWYMSLKHVTDTCHWHVPLNQWHVSAASACACISDMYQWHVSAARACACISDMY